MNLKTKLIAYLLCMSSVALAQEKQLTNSRHYSTADGLPCNQVFDMKQDYDGYIWLATANGLCRYDGYQFLNFYNLGTSGIHAVLGFVEPDDDGRHIWMQTSTYIFACYDIADGRFVDFTGRGDDQHAYRKFAKDNNGVIWMFDNESGVRRVKASADGSFVCQDYTKEQGKLPSNHVNDALRDNDSRLWVMTAEGLTIIDSDGKAKTITTRTGFLKAIEYGDKFLMITANSEVAIYDKTGRELKRKPFSYHVPAITDTFIWQGKWIITTHGETFYVDPIDCSLRPTQDFQISRGFIMYRSENAVFVSNPSGTLWVFPRNAKQRQYNLMDGVESTVDRIRRYNVAKGSDGLYYIASHGNGLFVYNLEYDHMTHYSATSMASLLGSNFLNNILIDRSGCIWLGEELTGMSCILPPTSLKAHYIYPKPEQQGNWNNYVRMIHHNDDGSATLSTRDNNLYHFNPQTSAISHIEKLGATAYAEWKDKKGRLWIGTRGAGLYVDGKHKDIPSQNIYDITEDKQGRIWLGTWGEGLFLTRIKDDGTLDYQQLMKRSYNESIIRCVEIDKNGNLWIASNNGVYSLSPNKQKISDKDLVCSNMKNGLLPFDEVISLTCTSDGNIWVSSRGGGLLCCKPKDGQLDVIKTFTKNEGLSSNNIYSTIEDRNGNIWIGTDNGICSISPSMKVNSYIFGQTTQSNVYTENCAAMLRDGRLLFGTINGLMVLTPSDIDSSSVKDMDISPIITSISINGISRYLSPKNHSIKVDHDENSLVLNFSCLDFADRSATQYQYYMEGVDRDWLPLTTEHQAHYNVLQPGRYRFKVRSLGKDGQWGDETVFAITICQPWYNTWWAWLIYMFIIGVLIWYFYRAWRRNFELDQQIKVEKELSTFRLNFFTHIAHEFRTPLAIISGAADKLTTNNDQQVSRSAVQTVRRGTLRLSKLVNQLMEFRKINTGNQRLRVIEDDIIKLARTTCDEFREVAARKNQSLTFTPFAHNHRCTFDPHIIETILYNLLSNAIKYTPQGGSISIKAKLQEDKLLLIVEDSGPGISEQQIPQLYQPFMHGYVSQGGMGIGLYTAYQSAKFHKGNLAYERISAEGGSRFTVTIPVVESAYSSDDYANTAVSTTSLTSHSSSLTSIKDLIPKAFNDYTVAIIEDDPDMMDQIRESIGRYFRIDCYTDGQSALNGIKEKQPSLILCDIMLPDINGYEIVRQLRADKSIRQVPIIMLTALDGDEHLLKGYKAGADDYMVKPCNFELLVLRITQLIKWYDKVRPADGETPEVHQQPIITDEADQRFREKMETIIAQHLGDADFNVDTLASMLKMGRTKFYGKMKEFTGMSPNNYLQTERLKKAAELLIEGDLNVTEISYKVGFQSPTYFYKCFKEKYGVPPSKYGKQK